MYELEGHEMSIEERLKNDIQELLHIDHLTIVVDSINQKIVRIYVTDKKDLELSCYTENNKIYADKWIIPEISNSVNNDLYTCFIDAFERGI